MHFRKTDAVVLNRADLGEADILVTLYTSSAGKIRGVAKGAKKSHKRFMNTLQPFSYIRVIFAEQKGGLIRIDQADIIRPFLHISDVISRVLYGFYVLELVERMSAEREANPQVFDFLVSVLGILDRGTPREELLRYFELRVLDLFGYRPRLGECTVCSQTIASGRDRWFSFRHGGIVCSECKRHVAGGIPISHETTTFMERMFTLKVEESFDMRFPDKVRHEAKYLLPRFVQYQLGRELKSLRVLEEIQERGEGAQ